MNFVRILFQADILYYSIYLLKNLKKYRVRIHFKNKSIALGCYKTLKEAKEARKEAEEKYFKPILDKYKNRASPEGLA